MRLDAAQKAFYAERGHLTVPGVFAPERMQAAIADAIAWGEALLAAMDEEKRAWYLDRGAGGQALRKIDQPVFHREAFRGLARDPALLGLVEDLIGPPEGVAFSQIFFKPPEGGGPKPVHQDNFYFGPNDPEGMVTAWIAMDEARTDNGCLFMGEGTNRGPVLPHEAPPGEPFNLQIPEGIARRHPMTAAPVPRGGVSFHHGNTLHQSSANLSPDWRRAVAIHYYRHGTTMATPALAYDLSQFVPVP